MTALPMSYPVDLWSPARRARLVRLCSVVSGDPSAADDLAQETLLEAWRHQHRLTDPTGADAWLDAVARNVCRRWRRARGALPVPVGEVGETGASHLDSVLEREELVELLDRALGLLPPATRAALVGHYVEERSHAEIAERLGTSADAVSMRVSRGRVRLRHLLETRFADEAVAEGWARRDDVGWRPTRLRCPDCGHARVELRHDSTEVAFRCASCDPDGLSVRIPLDAPGFERVLGDVRRPSALQARVAAWTRSYWDSPADPPCVRCARPVRRRPYVRDDVHHWSGRHGWHAVCQGCGEEVSGSVAGRALSLPEVQAARRREPRLRALPVRDVVRDGREAKVVAFGRPDGTELVSAVFLRDSLRLVASQSSLSPDTAR